MNGSAAGCIAAPGLRVALREWHESDAPALFFLAKDAVVGKAAGFHAHEDEAERLRVIREIFCKPESYAIVAANGAGLRGCINLYPGRKGENILASAEVKLGYWLGRPFWGQGLMGEAVRLMCARAFGSGAFKCTKVVGYAKETNLRSRRVLEKTGFVLAGIQDGGCRYELARKA